MLNFLCVIYNKTVLNEYTNMAKMIKRQIYSIAKFDLN